jgi:hypothetical protein
MSRRTLHVICGIAVLFASILYAHLFHHVFFVERQEWNAVLVAGVIVSAVAGVFSFIGSYLLLTDSRRQNPN